MIGEETFMITDEREKSSIFLRIGSFLSFILTLIFNFYLFLEN